MGVPSQAVSTSSTRDNYTLTLSLASVVRWKHRFIKDVLAHVTAKLCSTAKPVKYADILELDSRMRSFNKLQNPFTAGVAELLVGPHAPEAVKGDTNLGGGQEESPGQTMQRFSTVFFKEIGKCVLLVMNALADL